MFSICKIFNLFYYITGEIDFELIDKVVEEERASAEKRQEALKNARDSFESRQDPYSNF